MITDNTFNLLRNLLQTQSPSVRQTLVLKYCLLEGSEENKENIKQLIDLYEAAITKKKEEGVMSKGNTLSKKKTITYIKPKFFNDNKCNSFKCEHCNETINSNNIFKIKTNGKYKCWHALPDCFPSEFETIMRQDKGYIKFIENK